MRVRHPVVPKGTAIGIGEAARKYGVDIAVISRWKDQDKGAILKPAAFKGDSVLIDEAWLQGRLREYEPHRDNSQRRNRLGRTLVEETRPVAVAANGNGHAAATALASPQRGLLHQPTRRGIPQKQGGIPVLNTREWVELFYAAKARAKGGAITSKTKATYDMVFKDPHRFLDTFATVPMGDPARLVIMEYIHGLKNWGNGRQRWRALSASSKQLHLRRIRTFYGWLGRERGFKDQVPDLTQPDLEAPRESEEAFTQDEIRRLLALVRGSEEYTFVLTMAQTGCRRGELCSLTIENLHDHWALAKGKPTRANKTGERILYLADECYAALRKHLTIFGRPTWNAEPLTEDKLSRFIRRLEQKAGVYSVGRNTHGFRRAYEAEFLRNGGKELFLDEILGHRKAAERSKYMNAPIPEILEQAIAFAPRRFLQPELPGMGRS